MVLRDLNIYENTRTLVSIKEGSCIFWFLPLLKKKLVIPSVKINSATIFLQRRPDNTLNIIELFPTLTPKKEKRKFEVFVNSINIKNSRIDFQDDAVSPTFIKSIENVNITLSLSLPTRIKFNLKSEIPVEPKIIIGAIGLYNIIDKTLDVQLNIKDFSPRYFASYYHDLKLSFTDGTVDILSNFNLKNNILTTDFLIQNKNLVISKDKITASLDLRIKGGLQYDLTKKEFKFSGQADIINLDLTGLGFVGDITDINGQAQFNNNGINAEELNANISSIPLKAKVKLTDFSKPLLSIEAISTLDLALSKKLLSDKFKLTIPADIQGKGNLFLKVDADLSKQAPLQVSGYIDLCNTLIKINNIKEPFKEINGRVNFIQEQLGWSDINFKYFDTPYLMSGKLANFKNPLVYLSLSSQGLSLETSFGYKDNIIEVSQFKGKYLNSEFSFIGDLNIKDSAGVQAEIQGGAEIDLKDLKSLLKKYENQIDKIKPEGIVHARLDLNGNIKDIKSCTMQLDLSSDSVSFYGLYAEDFFVDYNQENGIVDIPCIRFSLYDGNFQANARMNLNSENLPYSLDANIQNLKIERLKMDTAVKDKDISGNVQLDLKVNGFSNDISKLSGAGRVFIANGKLWELNLFKGLGSLIFARDFAHIIFHDGNCSFTIKDKKIFTDNLRLKSNIANLFGAVKIGFDNSIDASINIEILDEFVPLTGTFKDIATAIVGKAESFGTIKITGTLQQPEYKFVPAVINIIKGIKDSIFGTQ